MISKIVSSFFMRSKMNGNGVGTTFRLGRFGLVILVGRDSRTGKWLGLSIAIDWANDRTRRWGPILKKNCPDFVFPQNPDEHGTQH